MSRRNRKKNRAVRQTTIAKENANMNEMNKVNTEGSAADWTEIRTLPVGMLEVDPKYQRHLDAGWAKWIAAHFNPDLVSTLQVSYRDGHYWVFDGQHTLTALKMKFKDDNYPVVCKIYHGLTDTEEAKLFYDFNISKKKMSSASMLKAQAAYGDEDVQNFLKHTKDAGFIIDPAKRVCCRYGIQAVKKAQNCFTSLGGELYDRMLCLIKATWGGEQWSVTQNMLGGMAALLKTFGDKVDDEVFTSRLKNVTENQMVRGAGRYCDESVSVAYASALVDFYNKGLRGGKLKKSKLLDD